MTHPTPELRRRHPPRLRFWWLVGAILVCLLLGELHERTRAALPRLPHLTNAEFD